MDYTNKIKIFADTKNCFNAVSQQVDKWWGKVDNRVSKVGDEFSVHFGATEWRFKITEFIPFERITWHCIKAVHIHGGMTGIEQEWLNTKVKWHFRELNGKTEISFLHEGLISEMNCYQVCKQGWDFFTSTSLKEYLETGKGQPSF